MVVLALLVPSLVGAWSSWSASTAAAETQTLYHPAAKATATRGTAVTRGPDSLELLSQTPWLGPRPGQFQLHLKITASAPAAEMLEVNVYSELTTRSQFQAALAGEFYGLYYEAGGAPSR